MGQDSAHGICTRPVLDTDDDFYRFYEINPDVIKIARTQFSFLKDSKAQIEIKLGDARVSFERYLQPQNYDVIVLDAFSGDAIPVHLLTVEAFQLYHRHLNPNGVIVVHVSNRYLNLFPVVAFAARKYGMEMVFIEKTKETSSTDTRSHWLLLSRNKSFVNFASRQEDASSCQERVGSPVGWTDQHVSRALEVISR